jgi:hypothetical protein
MKLALATATLVLIAGMATPVFAATPSAPILASLQNAASSPVEVVQYKQRQRQARNRGYRGGYNAYARAPAAAAPYATARPRRMTPWGQCVSGVDRGARSAFPSWDLC